MEKNESKYFYTAQLMNQALISLLEKKDIEFITVTEITKKAGVNRSTFYLHYENTKDLLQECVEMINKKFKDNDSLNFLFFCVKTTFFDLLFVSELKFT